jgi:excinuclease UvrABC ATPase subunit
VSSPDKCPKCKGKGTVFTDHGMAGVDTTSECPACDGSGVGRYHEHPTQHDYEPGDGQHPMETDPLCRLCGRGRREHD